MHATSLITLHFRAESYDYPSGSVDAGTIMTWIDKAGYATAATWAKNNVVASYVGNMLFDTPVPVETTVRVESALIFTGSTSVHVQCRVVLPEILDEHGEPTVATQVVVIYVAVDDNNKPLSVPSWEPEDEAGKHRQAVAARRAKEHRAGEDALGLIKFPPEQETSAQSVTLRFIGRTSEVYPGARLQAGTMMSWMDESAGVCAARWTGKDVVPVFAGGVQFYDPVFSGQLLEINSRIVHVSERSMHILTRVWAGNRTATEMNPIAQGLSVFVALGADENDTTVPVTGLSTPADPTVRRAQPIPQWTPHTQAEKALAERSVELVSLRNKAMFDWHTPTS